MRKEGGLNVLLNKCECSCKVRKSFLLLTGMFPVTDTIELLSCPQLMQTVYRDQTGLQNYGKIYWYHEAHWPHFQEQQMKYLQSVQRSKVKRRFTLRWRSCSHHTTQPPSSAVWPSTSSFSHQSGHDHWIQNEPGYKCELCSECRDVCSEGLTW